MQHNSQLISNNWSGKQDVKSKKVFVGKYNSNKGNRLSTFLGFTVGGMEWSTAVAR